METRLLRNEAKGIKKSSKQAKTDILCILPHRYVLAALKFCLKFLFGVLTKNYYVIVKFDHSGKNIIGYIQC